MSIETTIYAPDSLQFTGDAWLRFDTPEDEEVSGEANIVFNGNGYFVAYVEAVYTTYAGPFNDYDSAGDWLTARGYDDYSSEPITLMKPTCDYGCTYHTILDNECVDEQAEFDELLDSAEPIEMLGMFFPVSVAIKNLDPTAYRCGVMDYADELVSTGEWIEL